MLVIFALAIGNGLLAGAEIAVVSLRKSRLLQLVEQGSSRARAVSRLREQPERFLATVQIGITVVGAATGAFGGATMAGRIAPFFMRIPVLEPFAGEIALALVVSFISFVSLVFGELVPKSLALRASEPYALLVGRPLEAVSQVARPVVWFLTAASNLVLRVFGDRTSFVEARLSPEEIMQLLEEASRTGSIEARASDIASRAVEFGGLTAGDVMVPRNGVVAIERNTSPDDVRRLFLDRSFVRVPVFESTVDNVVGYIAARDVLVAVLQKSPQTLSVEDLLRPATFLPEAMRAVAVLEEMQKRRAQLAIIVDERGGMAGLITIEDLLEELVGEIGSEDDRGVPNPIRQRPDGTAVVLGSVPIREVNRTLGIALPEGELWTTVAGYCIKLAGRIPESGERFVAEDGSTIEVLESTPRRIRLLRLRRPVETSTDAAPAPS